MIQQKQTKQGREILRVLFLGGGFYPFGSRLDYEEFKVKEYLKR